MLKRLFKALDNINKQTPLEKATIQWEETKEALLDSLCHEEYYRGLSTTLKAREQRLAAYVSKGENDV